MFNVQTNLNFDESQLNNQIIEVYNDFVWNTSWTVIENTYIFQLNSKHFKWVYNEKK